LARDQKEAIVVGSGPNGLAAAIALAKAGLEVTVYEKHEVIGGGCRSLELIQKGYIHDVCSTVHLQAKLSPFFSEAATGRVRTEMGHTTLRPSQSL